jgi:hypothetical protein
MTNISKAAKPIYVFFFMVCSLPPPARVSEYSAKDGQEWQPDRGLSIPLLPPHG